MIKRKESVERRKDKRFEVQEGTFAVFTPHFSNWGQVIDISRHGLAFRYTGKGLPKNMPSQLGISIADIGFYLGRVPFKVISDFEIARAGSHHLSMARQCGVEFGELTPGQISQLEFIISNYTQTQGY